MGSGTCNYFFSINRICFRVCIFFQSFSFHSLKRFVNESPIDEEKSKNKG